MNALAMPISSRTAEERLSVCLRAKSLRMREERSATVWAILASSAVTVGSAGCISHDAIDPRRARCLPRVVEVVQVGYRLAHGEERLVRVQGPAEEHRQQLARAFVLALDGLLQLGEALAVMLLELRNALVRAAKRLAMRGQHQHVGRQVPVASDRL